MSLFNGYATVKDDQTKSVWNFQHIAYMKLIKDDEVLVQYSDGTERTEGFHDPAAAEGLIRYFHSYVFGDGNDAES